MDEVESLRGQERREADTPVSASGARLPAERFHLTPKGRDAIRFTDRGIIVEHGPPDEFLVAAKDERTRQFLSQIL